MHRSLSNQSPSYRYSSHKYCPQCHDALHLHVTVRSTGYSLQRCSVNYCYRDGSLPLVSVDFITLYLAIVDTSFSAAAWCWSYVVVVRHVFTRRTRPRRERDVIVVRRCFTAAFDDAASSCSAALSSSCSSFDDMTSAFFRRRRFFDEGFCLGI